MSGWGQGEWPTVHFNEANARRVAEAEAERDRTIAQARRIKRLVALVALIVLIMVFW